MLLLVNGLLDGQGFLFALKLQAGIFKQLFDGGGGKSSLAYEVLTEAKNKKQIMTSLLLSILVFVQKLEIF